MQAQQVLVDDLRQKVHNLKQQVSAKNAQRAALRSNRDQLLAALGQSQGEEQHIDLVTDYVLQNVVSYFTLCEMEIDTDKLHLVPDDIVVPLLQCIEALRGTYPRISGVLQQHYSDVLYPRVYDMLARHFLAHVDFQAESVDPSCLSIVNILLLMNKGKATNDIVHLLLASIAKRISFHFKEGSALLPQMFVLCSQWFQEHLPLLAQMQSLISDEQNLIFSSISWMYRKLLSTFRRIGLDSSLYTALLVFEEEMRESYHYPMTSYHASPTLFSELWLHVERQDAHSSFIADKTSILVLFQSLVNTRLSLLLDPQHQLMYFTEVLQPLLNDVVDNLDECDLSTMSFYQQAFEEWSLQPNLPTAPLITISEICSKHITQKFDSLAELAYSLLEEHGNSWLHGNRLVSFGYRDGSLSSQLGSAVVHIRGVFQDIRESAGEELYLKFLLSAANLFNSRLFEHFTNIGSFTESSGRQLGHDLNVLFSLWYPPIRTPEKLFKLCVEMSLILGGSLNLVSAVRFVDKIDDKEHQNQMLAKYEIRTMVADQVVKVASLREECM